MTFLIHFAASILTIHQQMQARCPEHRFLAPAILMGYRIIITARGYASLMKSANDLVIGSVYAISDHDEEQLDLCEGVPDGLFRREVIDVETERGAISCLVYVDPVQEEGAPREEYAERTRRGIADARRPCNHRVGAPCAGGQGEYS